MAIGLISNGDTGLSARTKINSAIGVVNQLVITAAKVLTVTNSLTLSGTDGTVLTFPSTTATIARTDAAQTFTGVQTFSTPIAVGSVAAMTATVGGGVPTPPNNTTTFLRGDGTWAVPAGGGGSPGGSSTQVQYNNSSAFGGITGATTDGTTLTLVAPVLGTPASGTLTNCTGLPAAGVVGTAAILGANTFTGAQTLSAAGAASTPIIFMSGAWFGGGSGTTTKPLVLIEPTGATSTGWNTSGTGLGINGLTGYTGLAIDCQINGVTKFNVRVATGNITSAGSLTCTTISATSVSGTLSFTARNATAIPAGGTAGLGYLFTSTANFGIFPGSGAPTLAAAKGSVYLRSDGTGITDRMYVNTDGSTTWTNVVTAA